MILLDDAFTMESKSVNVHELSHVSVCILLAAYRGGEYIRQQIESILLQEHTNWSVFVNIDKSNDNTESIVREFQAVDSRIFILKTAETFGSAGKNFYDLLLNAPIEQYDFVSFCDQDDIWHPDKLSAGLSILKSGSFAGYSSSVTAFYPSGIKKFIKKSHPQKSFDYKFESAGPGCTYIFDKKIGLKVRSTLLKHPHIKNSFYYHDWLIYFTARDNDEAWYIDARSFMLYRQHENNDTGANSGLAAALMRLRLFKNGWYLNQVYLLEDYLSTRRSLNNNFGSRDGLRVRWLWMFFRARRSLLHSIILCICMIFRVTK